ncbi:hypothetical protein ACLMJK_000221 [Lecanora helva]
MDNHYRKIDLQSPSDLTYLLNNIKNAAKEKLDLAIPHFAAPEGEDRYRSKVEELIQEYILQTLTLALPNLTLNGFDPPPTLVCPDSAPKLGSPDNDGNYEPYDPRLAEKLRTLYAEFEVQSTRVAELRREAPGAAARRYIESLKEELRVEEELERSRETRGEKMDRKPLDFIPLGRKEDVEKMWERGTQGLVDLEKIPEILAKLDRADKVAEVVESM